MGKKIIVLGANGMAGHVITKGLQDDNDYEVISVARSNSLIKPSVLMDVTNFKLLSDLIRKSHADVIINCVGILNQSAENQPDNAILLNSYLPHFLEAETLGTKTKIIHISTDCVFSGESGSYDEYSHKDGRGFYSETKALGELVNDKDLTFRTSIIGPELNNSGIGLFHWFANQNGIVRGYTNAIWTGITTLELLNAIKIAISENLCGLYHLVNETKISKHDLVNLLNKVFRKELIVQSYSDYIIDKSLINSRSDFSYAVKSYEEMITDMKDWISINEDIYPHYKDII